MGIHSNDILRADRILESLNYLGEKKPHMWWDEFEIQLNFAWNVYDKKERRQVHSEVMKLRTLQKKIKADFLTSSKATIDVALAAVPMVTTYDQAIKSYRQVVSAKYPPDITAAKSTRRINQTSRGGRHQRGGRGNRRGRGGRDGGRGRGRGGGNNYHPNQYSVRLKNGKTINVHSSFYLDARTWNQLPDDAQK